ncbi:MAG: M48 family metallopeptidase [Proteobacteria bacterium]|nr:M48 family metallopeptidase [Pseudomonadota bacterium]
MEWNTWTTVFATIFILHSGFEFALEILQHRHLKKPRTKVPAHLTGKVDLETIHKAAEYNRDKLRFGMFLRLPETLALWTMILWGFGYLDRLVRDFNLGALASGLAFLAILGGLSFVWNLPSEIYSTFRIEARYGFNRQTFRSFALDKLKEIIVSLILGGILVSLLLLFMEKGGTWWWVFAFIGVTAFQFLVTWLYPLLIMPLFNTFTPVDMELANAIAGLAKKVGFPLRGVVAMDGSKRSTHSNAFIIGLKGARRIVLFDTLIERIGLSQLLAVLAHELGHFRLKHLRRRLILVVVSLFALFAALALLREQPAAYIGFGFEGKSDWAALVVFSLVVSVVLAPFGWITNFMSRRDEFAADRFAVEAMQGSSDLQQALIVLSKDNLASPGSHKLYRSYHYSHPALRKRLAALRDHARTAGYSDGGEVDRPMTPEGKDTVKERDN